MSVTRRPIAVLEEGLYPVARNSHKEPLHSKHHKAKCAVEKTVLIKYFVQELARIFLSRQSK